MTMVGFVLIYHRGQFYGIWLENVEGAPPCRSCIVYVNIGASGVISCEGDASLKGRSINGVLFIGWGLASMRCLWNYQGKSKVLDGRSQTR